MTTPTPVYPGLVADVDPNCDVWQQLDTDLQTRVETRAGWLFWALTGRQFGTEQLTVRPVAPGPVLPTNRRSPWPTWTYVLCSDWRTGAVLDGPVITVDEVTVDGTVLDPSAYKLVADQLLLRIDGGIWPLGQSLLDAPTVAGTFTVKHTRGRELPKAGQMALGILCCELARAAGGDEKCRLPERVSSVSRQGIDVQFIEPQDLTDNGKTGVPEVDEFIAAVNPYRLPTTSDVWSPDLPANFRVAP